MTLKNRLWLYAAGGLVVGLILKASTGWDWETSFSTFTANRISDASFLLTPVAIAVAIGYFTRKKPNSN